MSMLSNLQRQCPNNLLNLQLIEVDLSIWIERTLQQDEKSNNDVPRQRTTSHLDDNIITKEKN
jgi:hypothetical protein